MSSTNWPTGLPFTVNPLADGPTTRDETYFWTNMLKPVSDGVTALVGGGWVVPALSGGWAVYDPVNWYGPSYKAHGAQVRLRGLVKNGATGVANPIFTLPVALAPSALLNFTVLCSNGATDAAGSVSIDTTGRVYVTAYQTGGGNAFLVLDGIVFMAD